MNDMQLQIVTEKLIFTNGSIFLLYSWNSMFNTKIRLVNDWVKLSEPGNHPVNGFKQQKIENLKFLARSNDMKEFDLIGFGRIH